MKHAERDCGDLWGQLDIIGANFTNCPQLGKKKCIIDSIRADTTVSCASGRRALSSHLAEQRFYIGPLVKVMHK